MWHPPERVKHAPLPARWPDQAEAARSLLFSPLSVGRLTLADRTWVPAMVPWRATDEGFVTDDVLTWYERFARGQPGAIVVEATGVRDIASGPLLRIGDDRFLPGLETLVRTVREASRGRTKLFIQIIDFLTDSTASCARDVRPALSAHHRSPSRRDRRRGRRRSPHEAAVDAGRRAPSGALASRG